MARVILTRSVLKAVLGRFEDEIVQIRGGIVAGPNGVCRALFIEDSDFDDSAGATRLANANFFRVRPSADALG